MRPHLLSQLAEARNDEPRHSPTRAPATRAARPAVRVADLRTKQDSAPRLSVASRLRNELELDHAFLDWFESRLMNSGPDPREQDMLDYLVAWGLLACG
jgi:hypothetical protein